MAFVVVSWTGPADSASPDWPGPPVPFGKDSRQIFLKNCGEQLAQKVSLKDHRCS